MLFVTILVLGTLAGWVMLRDAANAELVDYANSLAARLPYFSDPNRGTTSSEMPPFALEHCLAESLEDLMSETFYACADVD